MNIHHEEKIINGVLNQRKSFSEKWKSYTKKELTKMVIILRESSNNDLIVDKTKIIKTEPKYLCESCFSEKCNCRENIFKRFVKWVKRL